MKSKEFTSRFKSLGRRHGKRIFDALLWGSILVYLFVLANLLLFKYISPSELFSPDRFVFRDVNFIPFAGIWGYLFGNVASSNIALGNVFGNILIFMPMGLLLRLMRPGQPLKRTVIIVCLSSIAVETAQFAMGIGSADIDDVILNTLGGLLGALVFLLLRRVMKDRAKIRALIAILAAICAAAVMVTQGRVFIQNYSRDQMLSEWTEKYGMILEQADVSGIYQSFHNNIICVMVDGEELEIALSNETLISIVRRQFPEETIDYFEPIDIAFLADTTTGGYVWIDLSESGNEAVKVCVNDR